MYGRLMAASHYTRYIGLHALTAMRDVWCLICFAPVQLASALWILRIDLVPLDVYMNLHNIYDLQGAVVL